jgi:hypothetical protein
MKRLQVPAEIAQATVTCRHNQSTVSNLPVLVCTGLPAIILSNIDNEKQLVFKHGSADLPMLPSRHFAVNQAFAILLQYCTILSNGERGNKHFSEHGSPNLQTRFSRRFGRGGPTFHTAVIHIVQY